MDDARVGGGHWAESVSPETAALLGKQSYAGLGDAENAIIEGMTDSQLSKLFELMGPEGAASFQRRHPEVTERVHLYALRKFVATVKAIDDAKA